MASRTIRVHDLFREFAKLEAEGKLDKAAQFKKRRWVWYEDTFPTDLEMTPSHGCWHNLTEIGIKEKSRFSWHDGRSIEGIEWRYCSNVVVLKLEGLTKLRGDLSLKGLKCLRSLELFEIGPLDSLDGHQDLKNLTYFRWNQYENYKSPRMSEEMDVQTSMCQLPSSLKVLYLRVGVWLRPDVFDKCARLSKVELPDCCGEILDFSNCLSLHSVKLSSLRMLTTLLGVSPTSVSRLYVDFCSDLFDIPGLDHLVGLKNLHIISCKRLPDLSKLTRLEVLYTHGMDIGALGCLRQLRELRCPCLAPSAKLPSLSGFERLEVVDFSNSDELSTLEGIFVGDLHALRSLNLGSCDSLVQLPDLSRLMNLEELDLCGSGVELGEEDICMLAALPLLQPVLIGDSWGYCFETSFRLDAGSG